MRCLGAVACAALLAGCASMGLGGPDVRYLVDTAEHVARVESRLAGLWPGYWEAGRPFIVYHPDQAVLLVMDGPAPEGFVTLERVPMSLRGRAHVRAGRLRGLDGNIDLAFRVGTRDASPSLPGVGAPVSGRCLVGDAARGRRSPRGRAAPARRGARGGVPGAVSDTISRADVARAMLVSLLTPEARNRIFEVVSRAGQRGAPGSGLVSIDWRLA